MTTKTKILLGISLSAFLASLTGVLWGLFLPIGAVFFGLFMIFNLLGKETSLFEEEQQLRFALAEKNTSSPRSAQQTHREASLSAVPIRGA
jgi:hypothetical protein